jgi:DNA-binding LacI/PurR family transcriptional regulator
MAAYRMGKIIRNARAPLYQQVAGDLEGQIASGALVPGAKLLSERQLCEQYDVSQITVRRALRELAHAGKVYSQHGLGWFVTEAVVAEGARGRVGMVVEGMEWPFAPIATCASSALSRFHLCLDLYMWPTDGREPLSSDMAREEMAVALYCPAGEQEDALSLRIRLEAWERPILGVGLELDEESRPGVYLDIGLGTESVTEHLLRQGRERLAYLGARPTSTLGRLTYWAFAEAVWGAGLDLPLEWVLDGDALTGQQERLTELLRSPSRPDGIVCTSADAAASALSAVYAAGLRCPNDVALVTLGEDRLPEQMTPPITSYQFDMPLVGERIAQSARTLLAGQPVGAERLAGTLVERFSSRV